MSARLDWLAETGRPVSGEVYVPGDKSISHRAIMLASLADGVSHVRGFLEAEDTRATAYIMQKLGVRVETPAAGERIVYGVGLNGLRAAGEPLNCGNAGTGMRLLAGLLAGQGFDSTLLGDASLSQRPMGRICKPLDLMGARITSAQGQRPPLQIHAKQNLRAIDYRPPMASAQVKSAVLLAGLYATGKTTVSEIHPTRDYTERMLAAFGWPVEFEAGLARLSGGSRLKACDIEVPGDFSSAALLILSACIVPGSHLLLRAVGLNPRRTGLLDVLRLMGAQISIENSREVAGESIGNIHVRHAPLHGVDVPLQHVSDMIDEFPALFVAAAAASGCTRIRGVHELRVKESDRITAMAAGLRSLGVTVDEHPDGADITGKPEGFSGGTVATHADHRIAMSLAVAAARAHAPVRITDCANVDTSFPGFVALARQCGLAVQRMPCSPKDA